MKTKKEKQAKIVPNLAAKQNKNKKKKNENENEK